MGKSLADELSDSIEAAAKAMREFAEAYRSRIFIPKKRR